VATSTDGVQTVQRALQLLEVIADNGEALNVTALAALSGLPLPTVHRLLRSMVSLGYVRQLPSRKYGLGTRLIGLGKSARNSFGVVAESILRRVVESTGETANLAMFEDDMVVYIAQVPSKHSMRMFTEIGRHVLPHATGVGKAMLSQMSDAVVTQIVRRTGLPAQTDKTLTNINSLLGDLEVVRERGWAEDNGEQETGVRCVAVPVPNVSTPIALSVSGPEARMTAEAIKQFVPQLKAAAEQLSAEFSARESI
jgi:IclR family transcriptional regulator, acetate operon repressor